VAADEPPVANPAAAATDASEAYPQVEKIDERVGLAFGDVAEPAPVDGHRARCARLVAHSQQQC